MKKLFFLGAMVCVFGLITACHDEGDEKNDILGEWQWVSTEVKCMDGYVGYDTTYNEAYPMYKNVKFYENGSAEVQQQVTHIPEQVYYWYDYNYYLNDNDTTMPNIGSQRTILFSDPENELAPIKWTILYQTPEDLIMAYNYLNGTALYIISNTYHHH